MASGLKRSIVARLIRVGLFGLVLSSMAWPLSLCPKAFAQPWVVALNASGAFGLVCVLCAFALESGDVDSERHRAPRSIILVRAAFASLSCEGDFGDGHGSD